MKTGTSFQESDPCYRTHNGFMSVMSFRHLLQQVAGKHPRETFCASPHLQWLSVRQMSQRQKDTAPVALLCTGGYLSNSSLSKKNWVILQAPSEDLYDAHNLALTSKHLQYHNFHFRKHSVIPSVSFTFVGIHTQLVLAQKSCQPGTCKHPILQNHKRSFELPTKNRVASTTSLYTSPSMCVHGPVKAPRRLHARVRKIGCRVCLQVATVTPETHRIGLVLPSFFDQVSAEVLQTFLIRRLTFARGLHERHNTWV